MMYTNDEEPYYETVEPPHKRQKVLREVKEEKCFRLEHKLSDEPGVVKLTLREPVTLDADVYYAAIALQDITYSHRWRNLKKGFLTMTLHIFDGTVAESSRVYLQITETQIESVHFECLEEIMKHIKIALSRRVRISAVVRALFSNETGPGLNLEDYLKINYANNILTIVNNDRKVGFRISFSAAFRDSFSLSNNSYIITPFGVQNLILHECTNTENEYISLHLPGLKNTITSNGKQSILHSFSNKNKGGCFNTFRPSPRLEFKELEVPCIIRELCVTVKNIEGENIDFIEAIRDYRSGLRSEHDPVDCIINLVLVVKKLE